MPGKILSLFSNPDLIFLFRRVYSLSVDHSMPDGVTVAQLILVQFVLVQIQVRQPFPLPRVFPMRTSLIRSLRLPFSKSGSFPAWREARRPEPSEAPSVPSAPQEMPLVHQTRSVSAGRGSSRTASVPSRNRTHSIIKGHTNVHQSAAKA